MILNITLTLNHEPDLTLTRFYGPGLTFLRDT